MGSLPASFSVQIMHHIISYIFISYHTYSEQQSSNKTWT